MDAAFWHQRWQENVIGFHQSEVNALLAGHFDALSLTEGSRVFLPLCGKTRDIAWLLAQGFRIAGCELSALAVDQLFDDLGVAPERTDLGAVTRYSAPDIDIFVGDVFELTGTALGPVDAVYDRAALVALPEDMRGTYAGHLTAITDRAPQFLICFEYDQTQMEGPPFSVPGDEVHRYYDGRYDVTQVAIKDVTGGLKGRCAATEIAWRLK